MIYTLTLNPSIDYIISAENFRLGGVNRSGGDYTLAGGKGLNVSVVLTNLDVENIALGFTAGFTGSEIKRRMREYGCENDFVSLESGISRINVKLKTGEETEINGRGPDITPRDRQKLFEKLDRLEDGDWLILAGSAPASLGNDIYAQIMRRLNGKNVRTVVDASGETLRTALAEKPFLVKPNHIELGELLGCDTSSPALALEGAKELCRMGARNVLVSMAENGAVFSGDDGADIAAKAPHGAVLNSVGAGDSMVAGFVAGFMRENNAEDAVRLGVAAGSASAFSDFLADREEIMNLYMKVSVDFFE